MQDALGYYLAMKEIFALLDFGGYIALLLWGIHMVQSGVQRAFGAELGVWMGHALGRPRRAFFAGAVGACYSFPLRS